jgi:hypothetical protein
MTDDSKDKDRKSETTTTAASSGLGKCEASGCSCPQFIPTGGGSFDSCSRSGCGHRDLDHKIT